MADIDKAEQEMQAETTQEAAVTETAETKTADQAAQQQAAQTAAEKTQDKTEAAQAKEKQATEAAEAKEAEKTEKDKASKAAEPDARVVDAELRAAAALAGIPAERIPYAVRLADRTKASEAEDTAAWAEAQIKQIVQDLPELARQANGTGSAGERARQSTAKKDPFLQGLEG